MGQFLIISKVKDSGKTDNYGNHKCYISMTDESGEIHEDIYAAFKTVPTEGTKKYGEVVNGEYGLRFQREDIPEGIKAPETSSKASQGSSDRKMNSNSSSDGARQGMAINNASAYVISQLKNPLEPDELAAEIRRYAKAIFNIDLSNNESDVMDMMTD